MASFNLPTPKLGNVAAITIASPDLEASLAYYQRLGFSPVKRADQPTPWVQISDGGLLITLREDPHPSIALTYYTQDGAPTRHQSPDGINIHVEPNTEGFTQPTGPTMLTLSQEDYTNPDKYGNKICGMFGEFAHPVVHLDVSIAFWATLGFVPLFKHATWAILSDGLVVLGLHQTTSFTHPTLTYFAADMASKIADLKAAGLADFTEVQGPDNIVLTTPENQRINLFNWG